MIITGFIFPAIKSELTTDQSQIIKLLERNGAV